MNEFDRIARYFRPLAEGYAGALSLGDDAALLQIPADAELVVTTDAMVEGVHFSTTDSPQTIAQRLLRSNVSDLAAMGAQPHAYTLITAFRNDVNDAWLESFSATLLHDQKIFAMHLIGGDTVRTDGPLHFSITAFGLVPRGQAIRRAVKKPLGANDVYNVFVSGTIGDSALGLMLLQGKKLPGITPEDEAFLKQRHFMPEPRIELGRAIRGFAQAAIDISDGLAADIGHIAAASKAQVTIEAEKVPLSPTARRAITAAPELIETILTGGEDYELAFVVDALEEGLIKIAAQKINVPLTKIGALQTGNGEVQIHDKQGNIMMLKQKGWQHF